MFQFIQDQASGPEGKTKIFNRPDEKYLRDRHPYIEYFEDRNLSLAGGMCHLTQRLVKMGRFGTDSDAMCDLFSKNAKRFNRKYERKNRRIEIKKS